MRSLSSSCEDIVSSPFNSSVPKTNNPIFEKVHIMLMPDRWYFSALYGNARKQELKIVNNF